MYYYVLEVGNDDFELNDTQKYEYYFKNFSYKRIKEIVTLLSKNIIPHEGQRRMIKEWREICKNFLFSLKDKPPSENSTYYIMYAGANNSIRLKKVFIPIEFDD
jgi:hypothetical protein